MRNLAHTLTWIQCMLLSTACAAGGSRTWVEGSVRPAHFKFKDVVAQHGGEVSGWRAACLHVGILREPTEELVFCKFGVGVPIRNSEQGFISVEVAQNRAAACANAAARETLMMTTPATPIGIACEQFKTLYDLTLQQVIQGSQVTKTCILGVPPVILSPVAPASR